MNYRHIYHAGNFADVVKHLLLTILLEYFRKKETPFFVLDTHAGIGGYNLNAREAAKTQEFRQGIGRVFQKDIANRDLRTFQTIIQQFQPTQDELEYYPGSPVIIAHHLRKPDRLHACELHPDDFNSLSLHMKKGHWRKLGASGRVRVFHEDAYQAMKAMIPPQEKRGLVLMDPPFETATEFEDIIAAVQSAYRRWRHGTFAIWYPIKDAHSTEAFKAELTQLGIPKILSCELLILGPEYRDRFRGTGLILINPPWQFDGRAKEALIALQPHLKQEDCDHAVSVEWLVGEAV